ncbi:hypothetical protein G7046_g7477 [Stylonectria norvegica]|nr:hypothetical protein G7046_g7477 [Stylonectria norvegica]
MSSNKGPPKGSSLGSGRKYDKYTSGRRKGKESSSSSRGSQNYPLSFLFVVNEMRIHAPLRDIYDNHIPPQRPSGYLPEIPSSVFRYYDGAVSAVPNYQWVRQNDRSEGGLWAIGADREFVIDPETRHPWQAMKYNVFAVFACNPLLPIMVVNADPMVVNTESRWELLQIYNPTNHGLAGISQVATEDSHMGHPGPGLCRHVAGSSPSWMPSLIPTTYKNPNPQYRSVGLGGELPIILGLMALTREQDPNELNRYTDEIFGGRPGHQGRWFNRHWSGTDRPRGHPRTRSEDPRGFLAVVFLDPENLPGSTDEALRSFEWERAIVKDSPP